MERWLPIVILGAGFMGLLGLRVVFLLVLRRGETPSKDRTESWPTATVIPSQTNDTRPDLP
jgi:hypothetical protein